MLNVVVAALLSGILVQAPPPGRTIATRDGDIVIINNSDTVRIVRRREGNVRVVFNPEQRFLVVLADNAGAGGAPPDGRVDFGFVLHDVEGEWPLDLRWEGPATLDDYVGDGGPVALGTIGLGLMTPSGLVQMFNGRVPAIYRNPAAIATLMFRGNSRGTGSGTMDQQERLLVAQAMKSVQMRTNPDGSPRFRTDVSLTTAGGTTEGGVVVTPTAPPAPTQPVRVGGNIKTPAKVVHVDAVLPETARQAGITGTILLEAVIGADGSVKDVKVLRSIPLLDAAAIDAVRQWRFEPTMLNGIPVPVIMTVTVNFQR